MSAKTLTLAKSLHTVSVLVAVGRFMLDTVQVSGRDHADDAALAVAKAAAVLGYDMANDPHGLVARAVAILSKEG